MSTTPTAPASSNTTTSAIVENEKGHVPITAGIRLYALWFRRGNQKPEMMVFEYKGNLPEAVSRGMVHCTRMDYRFCGCYPFVVNLDLREKYREENREKEETF